jgi:hypothetical protein
MQNERESNRKALPAGWVFGAKIPLLSPGRKKKWPRPGKGKEEKGEKKDKRKEGGFYITVYLNTTTLQAGYWKLAVGLMGLRVGAPDVLQIAVHGAG